MHTCIQISCCDYHSAAISTIGHLYTFGSKENGKLGHGRDVPSGSTGNVTRVAKFLDSDETTDMGDIRIGYVSCCYVFIGHIIYMYMYMYMCMKGLWCSSTVWLLSTQT